MTTKNKNSSILMTLVFLVCVICGWSVHHSMESRKYQDALINLGVSNCQRISQLEKYSYGYKDANRQPHTCPDTKEFLNK